MCITPNTPDWLPEIIDCNGSIDILFPRLYAIFCEGFKSGTVRLNELLVWYDRKIGDRGYENGFWHLIEREDKKRQERLFDPRRAERLPWLRPSIDHYEDTEIRFFEYSESGKIFAYVWLYNFDYVAVFIKREQNFGYVYFLKSAYYIDGNRKRKQLQKKYREVTF